MAALLYRLGSFAARRAWQVIVAWVLILGLSIGAFLAFGGSLSNSFDIPGTASGAVVDELTQELPDSAGMTASVVYQTDDGSPFTDEQKQEISDVAAGAEDLDDIASVIDPFEAQQQQVDGAQQLADAQTQIDDGRAQLDAGQAQLDAGKAQLDAAQAQLTAARTQAEAAGAPAEQLAALDQQQAQLDAQTAALQEQQDALDASRAELDDKAEQVEQGSTLIELSDGIGVVSEDGSTAIVNVTFNETRLELPEDAKQTTIDHFESQPIDGVSVYFGSEIAQGVPELFGVGEAIGLIFAAIVLIVTLGSLLAAALPIVTALVGIAVGVTASLSFSGIVNMASITPVLGVMLGLAVGIDYSLFIVYRHRKQLLRGVPVRESIGLATGTSGTAVVFAGSTVIVALLALNVTGIPFLGLMGTVGAVCIGVAVLVAITLAPALLGLLGTAPAVAPQARDDRRRDHAREGGEADQADVEPARDPHRARHHRGAAGHRHPVHVDAARPARRRQRAGRIDQLPGVPDHRGGVRRGRERTAARHRDLSRAHQRRRPPRRPGRGRRGARGPRQRGRRRADRRRPTTTRSSPSRWSPRRDPTASRPSSSCRTSAPSRRSAEISRSASRVRRRATSTSRRR